ncbi:MAG: SCP2 sterol-binding domain-containing protein [Lachnospiraceae bacterium]
MTYSEYFSGVKTQFMEADVSDIREHLAYQFNVTGESSGIFYVEVKDGELHIEPYEYYDRDAMFTASAETFEAILSGKLDPVLAFTLHKLKVEGDFEKALKLTELIKRR